MERIFARLRELHGADAEAPYLNSTTAKTHRHAAGARKALGPQAIGASRGGRGTSKNRKVAPAYDAHCYKSRHLVENFFDRIKNHRRVATRYEKCACYYLAMVTLSCILVWLQM